MGKLMNFKGHKHCSPSFGPWYQHYITTHINVNCMYVGGQNPTKFNSGWNIKFLHLPNSQPQIPLHSVPFLKLWCSAHTWQSLCLLIVALLLPLSVLLIEEAKEIVARTGDGSIHLFVNDGILCLLCTLIILPIPLSCPHCQVLNSNWFVLDCNSALCSRNPLW